LVVRLLVFAYKGAYKATKLNQTELN